MGRGCLQRRGGAGQRDGWCPRWDGAVHAAQNGLRDKTCALFSSGILHVTFQHSVLNILYVTFPFRGELKQERETVGKGREDCCTCLEKDFNGLCNRNNGFQYDFSFTKCLK